MPFCIVRDPPWILPLRCVKIGADQVTSVLIGASRPEQILDDLKALDNTAFTPDELRAIDAASGF